MNLVDILAITATTSGVALALAPLAQIRAIRQQGSSRGVSRTFLTVMLASMTLWLAYGIAIANPAMIVANSATVVMTGLTLVVAWRYRHGPPAAPAAPAAETTAARTSAAATASAAADRAVGEVA